MLKIRNNYLTLIAGILGLSAVILGAFGSHGLENKISEKMIEIYETGIFYHFIHTSILFVISISDSRKYFISFWLFLIGIVLFSFSLYIYSVTGVRFLPMITPIGGLFFIFGWIFIIIRSLKSD